MTPVEKLYTQLIPESEHRDPPRVVLHRDGTASENPYMRATGIPQESPDDENMALFGQTKHHAVIRKERPEHRLMLWMRLNGHSMKEIAVALNRTYTTVATICRQPWFHDAFVLLSSELGRDAAESFLKGHELPALQRLVDMSEGAESENTRLAATNALLDRIRGKPTVKVESKSSASVDVTVADVTTLLAERAANEQKLRANGIITGPN